MTLPANDLHWLAGLLEGEGCFTWVRPGCPAIGLGMTDRDIVERAATIMGAKLYGPYPPSSGDKAHREFYQARVTRAAAIGWMLTLYQLLGERRRAKIRDVVAKWRVYELAHSGRRNFSAIQVQDIRRRYVPGHGGTVGQLCREFAVTDNTIHLIARRQTWQHVA